jgi:hypothetical protein
MTRGLRQLQSQTIKHTWTPNGTLSEVKPARASGGAADSAANFIGMFFRGEHDTATAYQAQDVVVQYGGETAGLYCALTSVSAGGPRPGTDDATWAKLAEVNSLDRWGA